MEKKTHPTAVKIIFSCCTHQGSGRLTDQIDSDREGDGYFNGKNHEEKNVFGDGEVFKDFVRLLQKTSAYWRAIHPERIV